MSAEDNTEQKEEEEPTNAQKIFSRLGISPVAFVVTVVVGIVFMPTCILLLGGMVPTIIAYVLDETRKKSQTKAIAYMNLSGCFIVGMELWTGDNSVNAAIGIFLQPVNWLIMYGSALSGWILIKSLTPFITSYLRLNYQMQQHNLRKRRKTLLEEWGEPVATVSPDGEFIYDKNVYLDEDEITVDPDEKIDIIPEDLEKEQNEALQITAENTDSKDKPKS